MSDDEGTIIRKAQRADVSAIVAMLSDDFLGAKREYPADDPRYLEAFDRIDTDPSELLVVAESGGEPVGTLQLSWLPGLSRGGALRAQIEGVRVRSDQRGNRLGERLVRWAVDHARDEGAVLVQLTSDLKRTDAHRFYERLGFEHTHIGMKLALS
ncbi:GNAT family N-acetyltransferase [Sciscionella sediminilitoris]|uniref:GNAT family N-acetyltransferase n=1 Tax=Sciscionella sediminilitoris TaxID=1445613 RepID=UPI0004DF86F4|nr:GNAT family N-acetyltransferase [Sciscionella sp. SE31]